MSLPLVSCVMPTAGRRRWVPHAIRYFLRQDYPNRELVIVDDGDDAVRDLVPSDSRIRYMRLRRRLTLGAKQNLCVEKSRGDLILHWDDDDWFAPSRISRQVDALLRAGGEICGLPRMLFHDLRTARTWLYDVPSGSRTWLAGGSLLYTRDFWKRGPFPDVQVGADTMFTWTHDLGNAVILPDHELYVAMIHSSNTSPKTIGPNWRPWDGDLGRVMGEDLAAYDFARRRAEIIVPTFGQERLTVRCFDSILEHTSAYRLVWVDNGSSAASQSIVTPAFERHAERVPVRSRRNLGYVGGTNLGLEAVLGDAASPADCVVLLNNDTEVTAGWLDQMMAVLEGDPSVAAAGPTASRSPAWQAWPNVFASLGRQLPEHFDQSPAAEVSAALAQMFAGAAVPVSMIAFFCAVIRKRIFSEVGLLDPDFGAGLGDDDDYCCRIRKRGYQIAFVPAAYVVHHHRSTFRAVYSEEEIAALQQKNLATLRRKHGNAPTPAARNLL